jgi:hypothetical protein
MSWQEKIAVISATLAVLVFIAFVVRWLLFDDR